MSKEIKLTPNEIEKMGRIERMLNGLNTRVRAGHRRYGTTS